MMSDFHFLRPEWFIALLPLAALLSWSTFRKLHKGNWSRVVDPELQAHVLIQNQSQRRGGSLILLAIAGLLAITAMAGPSWQRLPLPVFKDESALVVALDLSSSMNAQDIKPSRLQRARLKLIDILRQRKSGQTALITYAANAFIVTPLTDDIETITTHIPNLSTDLMPSQGSRADRAIAKAIDLLTQAGINKGEVLLITDGAKSEHLAEASKQLQKLGHRLLILGVGTEDGAPIPASDSGFIKNRSGAIVIAKLEASELKDYGQYHPMTVDDQDINYLLNDSALELMDTAHKPTELNTDTWRDEGPWLLLPLLLLVPLGFRKGLLVLALCLTLPLSEPGYAMSWKNLWLNDDQRGAELLKQEQASAAAKTFDTPSWRAAAHYRAGEYEQALELLQNMGDIDSLYNKGNTLAKLGKIGEAIDAYNQVLEQNEEHEDARFNRDLLMQQQSQQQQQQQQQQNQDSSENQQQQNDEQNESAENQSQQQNEQSSENQQQQNSDQSQSSENQSAQQQNSDNSAPSQQQAKPEPTEDSEEEQENTQQTQQAEKQENENSADSSEQIAAAQETTEPDLEQQAMEQWLRRIPDDPAGLLRRKFQYQYRQNNSSTQESEPW